MDEVDDKTCEGWADKRGLLRRSFKRRWMVINPSVGRIEWYKTRDKVGNPVYSVAFLHISTLQITARYQQPDRKPLFYCIVISKNPLCPPRPKLAAIPEELKFHDRAFCKACYRFLVRQIILDRGKRITLFQLLLHILSDETLDSDHNLETDKPESLADKTPKIGNTQNV